MTEVAQLIAQYRAHEPGVDRGWLLRQLEHSTEPVAVAFLLEVLGDVAQDDYLRTEVLSGLKAREWRGPSERDPIARSVCRVLKTDEDDVLRNHAAMALVNYVEAPEVVATLERVVANQHEDESLRCCALDSLEANASRPECRSALVRLTALPDLGPEIRDKLRSA